MDRLTREHRSWLMARVGSKNTRPELIVRKLIWALGYRYRLHVAKLPGKPDIVITRLKKIIEVRGCFWHRHGCKLTTSPKTRIKFWQSKFERNIERDRRNIRMLKKAGWKVLVVWGCQLRNIEKARRRLNEFLQ